MVGLDPRPELLPQELRTKHALGSAAGAAVWARAVEEFCSRTLDVVAPRIPAVKLQTAFFEMLGAPGIRALDLLLHKARRLRIVTILDAKRGDIGSTSEAYAAAAFGPPPSAGTGGPWSSAADALTVNPFLGQDSLEPFLARARAGLHGLFVLVRTSNPGSHDLQQLQLTEPAGPVYALVARWVHEWSEATRGRNGYGAVGAVVGATAGGQLAELREAMPHALLLIPGYGAQGATAADIAVAFDPHGLGALVNSSRGVLFPPAAGPGHDEPWEAGIDRALQGMIEDLAQHTPAGRLRSSRVRNDVAARSR
jgi:orotidine-5'-phosphate decarboxylase